MFYPRSGGLVRNSLKPITMPKSNYQVGYCTNVHAGRDLPSVMDNLTTHCLPIRKLVDHDKPLGVGLWFSEISAAQALQSADLLLLQERLAEYRLVPFTLNGFPQGDFHSQVVKHRVYQPTWWDRARLDYTLNLVHLLDQILPPGETGSISTLPIAWGTPIPKRDQLKQAASQLTQVALELHRLFEHSGRKIVLAIEPEPGCYLTDSSSFRTFFNDFLREPNLPDGTMEAVGNYLTLCHDVCHAAVMFEDQAAELQKLKHEEIAVGKVQVSSAIQIDWDAMPLAQRDEAIVQLSGFAEDRYLHQTYCSNKDGTEKVMVEDLPKALASIDSTSDLTGTWRIHFHVPIFLPSMGHLDSTQKEIPRMLEVLCGPSNLRPEFTGHFEVETYAWGVLPESMREYSLNEGIAEEIQWFKSQAAIAKNT